MLRTLAQARRYSMTNTSWSSIEGIVALTHPAAIVPARDLPATSILTLRP